jgi:hypothetical protein
MHFDFRNNGWNAAVRSNTQMCELKPVTSDRSAAVTLQGQQVEKICCPVCRWRRFSRLAVCPQLAERLLSSDGEAVAERPSWAQCRTSEVGRIRNM